MLRRDGKLIEIRERMVYGGKDCEKDRFSTGSERVRELWLMRLVSL